MRLNYTMECSRVLKEKTPTIGEGFFRFEKLCALLRCLALCDLLHCLFRSLLHCLSFLCGHGGCELEIFSDKSTRSRMNIYAQTFLIDIIARKKYFVCVKNILCG